MVLVVIAAFDDLALRRVGGSGVLSADFEAKSSAIFRQTGHPFAASCRRLVLLGDDRSGNRFPLFGATP